MAVAYLPTPASMTAEQYDRVTKQLDASGAGQTIAELREKAFLMRPVEKIHKAQEKSSEEDDPSGSAAR